MPLLLLLTITACGGDDLVIPAESTAPRDDDAVPSEDTDLTEDTDLSDARPVETTSPRDLFATTTTKGTAPPRQGSDSGLPPVEFATADLSDRLGVDPTGIEVVSVESVTWPDTSLGCPQPGMAYNQVLTEGTRIVLAVGERSHHYHAGPTGDPFHCAIPSDAVPSPSTGAGDGY